MKEYAVVYTWEPYDYPFTDYVTEDTLEQFIQSIENHNYQHLIEYYEV